MSSAARLCTDETPLTGDTSAALDFLRHWEPNGPWLLTAIVPDGDTSTATFTPEQEADAFRWIESYQGRRNLYFSVNRPKRHLATKATKADIGWFTAAHVDVDPEAGKPLEEEKRRIIDRLMAFQPAPSVIIDSGGGGQAFWPLKEPVAIKDDFERYEAINKQLENALGGDHCFNIDRIMRLPGTINIPNKKKRAKGRQPALASIVEADWGRLYSPEDLEAAPSETHPRGDGDNPSAPDIDTLPVSARIKNLIRGVGDPEHPYKSRSEEVFAVLIAMASSGCSDEQMEAVLLDARVPIAAHVLEQPKPPLYLARQIKKARAARDDATSKAIAELNEKHALILLGDKSMVLKESVSADGRPAFEFLSKTAFNTWYQNRTVVVNDKRRTLGELWLNHPERRQYEGIVFLPSRDDPRFYNLWRGFAVAPRPGDWSLFRKHLRDNVCGGDAALLNWVIGWFAAIVQHPEKKVGTSLVIRGKEGTGKTKVGEVFGSLFGPHYVAVSDPRYVTGRFNSHLASCLLLHAEEAFWAGDHAAEGRLKDLITGEVQLIEYKGKEPITVSNLVRLFVTGNPEWVVPVSLEGRRFAVIEIGDGQIRNGDYFAAIDDQMNDGGREALLHDLMNFDLSTVKLRIVPKTAALLDQKIASLTTEQSWWLDVLQEGKLPRGAGLANGCAKEMLFDRYIDHANRRGIRRRSIQTQIGMFLNRMAPGLRSRTGAYRGYGSDMTGSIYEFPALCDCRTTFEKLIGEKVDWKGPGEWLEAPGNVPF
jgi:hypothetical protein